MKLITDLNDPRFKELSEIWGPVVRSEDKAERNAAIMVAWLMESLRVALSAISTVPDGDTRSTDKGKEG